MLNATESTPEALRELVETYIKLDYYDECSDLIKHLYDIMEHGPEEILCGHDGPYTIYKDNDFVKYNRGQLVIRYVNEDTHMHYSVRVPNNIFMMYFATYYSQDRVAAEGEYYKKK